MFTLSEDPLTPARYRDQFQQPDAGAFVTFEGWVRNTNVGRDVLRLEYEAYDSVVLKEGSQILAEADSRFNLLTSVCVHRIGSLEIGDLAVWIGVSSAHRHAGFDGCRYIIDELKMRVPIWKKEHYIDGESEWIGV